MTFTVPLPSRATVPRGRRRVRPLGRARRYRLFYLALLTPAVLLGLLIIAYPLYIIVDSSFRQVGIPSVGDLNSASATTANYKALFSDPMLNQSLAVSAIYTAVGTTGAFLLGLFSALLLNIHFPFRRLFRTLFLLPWAVPSIVAALIFLWILNASYGVLNYVLKQLHLIHSYIPWLASSKWALAGILIPTIWKSYPFFCLFILAALQAIPGTLYEAARVDGAGAIARFRAITWPGVRGAVYVALVLQVLWTFQSFELIYPMTAGGPAGSTQTLAIYLYNVAFQEFHMGYASVLGVVAIAICGGVVVIAYPRLRRRTWS